MRTRNSYFPSNSSVTILRRHNKRRTSNVVEPELRTIVEVAPMEDNRTMEELLQAPTEGMNTTYRENASKTDDRIDKLTDQISTIVDIFAKKVVTPAPVKAFEESCVTCDGPHAHYNCDATNSNQPSVYVATETEEIMDKEQTNFQESTAHIQPPIIPIPEPDVLKTLPKPNIPYPLRINDQKLHEKDTNQMEKLFELAKIPLNENCSAMLLKKLPENLGDPGKFLIPCDFLGMDMTLELADRSITHPKGVTEDFFVKVGKFHFLTDFVVVDFEVDHRVPFILGRSLLRTSRALIDVYGEEITLRVNDEAVTFNLNQTTRYMMIRR
nr:hypothetical protein [Tanacetum cinerariifolium]